jgi:hypothetical protein
MPSFAASKVEIYSSSIVGSMIVPCLELFQLNAPPFMVNIYPDCDFESSGSVTKLARV